MAWTEGTVASVVRVAARRGSWHSRSVPPPYPLFATGTAPHVRRWSWLRWLRSKWGARGLTKAAALELGRDNIRVNSIHPGVIRTPMIAGPAAAAFEALISDLAIPRVGEPDEITRLVLFVASDEASFSTGSEFIADGGLLLGPVPNSSPQGSNGRSRSIDSTTQPASRNKAKRRG